MQYAQRLLVVAHSGVDEFTVGRVDVLRFCGKLLDVFPHSLAIRGMFDEPRFHGVGAVYEEGFSAAAGHFHQFIGRPGFNITERQQVFSIVVQQKLLLGSQQCDELAQSKKFAVQFLDGVIRHGKWSALGYNKNCSIKPGRFCLRL